MDRETALQCGMLVLLADDNATNRTVIGRQLKRLGYAFDVAVDGEDALEHWRAGSYGLVLTDCHMPRRDGFSLAREIRRDPDRARAATPIVALTASVLDEDKEKAAASEIDELLLKPIPTERMAVMLDGYLPIGDISAAGSEDGADGGSAQPPGSPEAAPLDLTVLSDLVGEDPGVQAEVLGDFLETTEPDLEALRSAVADQSASDVRQLAHRVKGALASIGANQAASSAFAVEQAGASKDIGAFEVCLGDLDREWDVLKAYVLRRLLP